MVGGPAQSALHRAQNRVGGFSRCRPLCEDLTGHPRFARGPGSMRAFERQMANWGGALRRYAVDWLRDSASSGAFVDSSLMAILPLPLAG